MIDRAGMSIEIVSSSSIRAMAPPAAASGETWPIDRPEVPPENRPSVSSAHFFPRSRLLMYVVGYNIETKRGFGDPSAIDDGFDGANPGPFELRLLEVIEDRQIRDRVVVQSFIRESLESIHLVDPELRLAALTIGDADPGGYTKLGASVWSPKASTISERRLNEALESGLIVIPWTVNSLDLVETLIEAGVDGVITDRPDIILGR